MSSIVPHGPVLGAQGFCNVYSVRALEMQTLAAGKFPAQLRGELGCSPLRRSGRAACTSKAACPPGHRGAQLCGRRDFMGR
jgi:hypothetical protein